MKAILIDRKGFTKEIEVHRPLDRIIYVLDMPRYLCRSYIKLSEHPPTEEIKRLEFYLFEQVDDNTVSYKEF